MKDVFDLNEIQTAIEQFQVAMQSASRRVVDPEASATLRTIAEEFEAQSRSVMADLAKEKARIDAQVEATKKTMDEVQEGLKKVKEAKEAAAKVVPKAPAKEPPDILFHQQLRTEVLQRYILAPKAEPQSGPMNWEDWLHG